MPLTLFLPETFIQPKSPLAGSWPTASLCRQPSGARPSVPGARLCEPQQRESANHLPLGRTIPFCHAAAGHRPALRLVPAKLSLFDHGHDLRTVKTHFLPKFRDYWLSDAVPGLLTPFPHRPTRFPPNPTSFPVKLHGFPVVHRGSRIIRRRSRPVRRRSRSNRQAFPFVRHCSRIVRRRSRMLRQSSRSNCKTSRFGNRASRAGRRPFQKNLSPPGNDMNQNKKGRTK
jgi:hypothetical protein